MKKILFIKLIIASLFLIGCAGPKQAYTGKKLPPEEVSFIYTSKPQKLSDGKLTLAIESVNGITVGNKWDGYPPYVEVIPGSGELKTYFFITTTGKAIAKALGAGIGGAIGGALAASAADGEAQSKSIIYNVEKGKKYILNYKSNDGSSNDITIFLDPYNE